MRLLIFTIFSSFLLISCTEQPSKEKLVINNKDLLGEWSSESENEFFIFKDSVALPFDFYLYSNWKLDSNKLQIYNIESRLGEDSLWINYLITGFSKDSMRLISSVFNLDSSELTFYRKYSNTKNNIDFLRLVRPVYPGEESIFEIELASDGEVVFNEVTKDKKRFVSRCYFDSFEMNILNNMANQIGFSEIDANYISGISDQSYYTLEMATLLPRDTLKVTVDTGNVSPNAISRIITFIWATTKLKCTPSRYNDWRMYYNPIYPN